METSNSPTAFIYFQGYIEMNFTWNSFDSLSTIIKDSPSVQQLINNQLPRSSTIEHILWQMLFIMLCCKLLANKPYFFETAYGSINKPEVEISEKNLKRSGEVNWTTVKNLADFCSFLSKSWSGEKSPPPAPATSDGDELTSCSSNAGWGLVADAGVPMKADTRFSLFSPVKGKKKIQPTVPEENEWLSVSCDPIQKNDLSVCCSGNATNNFIDLTSSCPNAWFIENTWTNLVCKHPFMLVN